ncbi:hypothetical protein VTN96DRAFT_5489 [Rasamsonia emersonii]
MVTSAAESRPTAGDDPPQRLIITLIITPFFGTVLELDNPSILCLVSPGDQLLLCAREFFASSDRPDLLAIASIHTASKPRAAHATSRGMEAVVSAVQPTS